MSQDEPFAVSHWRRLSLSRFTTKNAKNTKFFFAIFVLFVVKRKMPPTARSIYSVLINSIAII